MKIIVDMDEMGKELNAVDSTERADLLLQRMRDIYNGEPISWAEPVKEKPKALPKEYTEAFEKFWAEWPKGHGSKKPAFKSWWKQAVDVGEELLLSIVLKALVWQKKSDQWTKDDGQYIPHAATWINQERFMDEEPETTETGEEYLAPDGTWQRR